MKKLKTTKSITFAALLMSVSAATLPSGMANELDLASLQERVANKLSLLEQVSESTIEINLSHLDTIELSELEAEINVELEQAGFATADADSLQRCEIANPK